MNVNVVIQEVWSITDAQADILCTAVPDAIDVNEGEEGIMLLRGGLIRLAFHDCVGDKCDGCINMDLDDNAGRDDFAVLRDRYVIFTSFEKKKGLFRYLKKAEEIIKIASEHNSIM